MNETDFKRRNVVYSTRFRTSAIGRDKERKWKERNRERLNASARAMIARRTEILRAMKTGPCTDCGGTFPPVCMDFDHRPGETKLGDVSALRSSMAKMLAEIAKCDLVCANCHRLRTAARVEERRATRPPSPPIRHGSAGARRRMTDDAIAEICGRVEHGEGKASVARRLNMSRTAVYAALARGSYGLAE